MRRSNLLKRDALGTIVLAQTDGKRTIVRNAGQAGSGVKWLARRLLRRDAAALAALEAVAGVPRVYGRDTSRLEREFLTGDALYEGDPPSRTYFREALRLLRRMHRCGVVHNDLAKEANWIMRPDGSAGLVDFQLAIVCKRRHRVFRCLAREDLRHLLKHKAHYRAAELTERQRRILSSPALPARFWRTCIKPPYCWVTRRVLGWPERVGPVERGSLSRKGVSRDARQS
jgi:RIO-like serine/threonine protein kinase